MGERLLITTEAAAEMLSLSVRTFSKRAGKQIPRITIGSCVRFRPEDVASWAASPPPTPTVARRQAAARGRLLFIEAQNAINARAGVKTPDVVGSCVPWGGALNRSGYGKHREAYVRTKGPVPPGLVLDHLCRNRACVNPDHLEPVTIRENNLRRPECVSARTGLCGRCGDPVVVRARGTRCPRCTREKYRRKAAKHG